MNALSLALIFMLILLSLWVCHSVAKKKDLNQRYWHTMAIIFGPFAIPFVFLAKPNSEKKDQNKEA